MLVACLFCIIGGKEVEAADTSVLQKLDQLIQDGREIMPCETVISRHLNNSGHIFLTLPLQDYENKTTLEVA